LRTGRKVDDGPDATPYGVDTPAKEGRILMEKLREAAVDKDGEEGRGDGEEEGEEIVLVDGNYPRVVQEEKDLVILEDVPILPPPTPSQSRSSSPTARELLNAFPSIPSPPAPLSLQQPLRTSPPIQLKLNPLSSNPQQTSPPLNQLQTPRRGLGGPTRASLHKAVLIRSAHRAVMRAEAEAESGSGNGSMIYEEEARMDGERDEFVGDEQPEQNEEEEEREVAAVTARGGTSESETGEDEDQDDEQEEEEREEEKPKSVWRKSWENLVGLVVRSGPPNARNSLAQEEEDEDDMEEVGIFISLYTGRLY
jgi:hypothetical protein